MRKIKIGFVGLGQRGKGMLSTFLGIENVDVVALCDVYQDRVEELAKIIKKERNFDAKQYNDFELMLKDGGLDAIYVASSWESHIYQAIKCMNAGIPCAMEVGGAYSIKDCWRLVKAYEKTKTPIMLMENCCYDKFELLTTALVRKGMLGEIIHCHGAYTHDLRDEIINGNVNRHYRLRNYISRNCDNYPTHELGPIAKILNINRGNRMLFVSSMASKARGLHEFANTNKCKDPLLKETVFSQGDIVSTNIFCENGETITMTLNTTLPAHYTREFQVKGTKGFADMDTNNIALEGNIEELWNTYDYNRKHFDDADKFNEFLPDYWKNMTEKEKKLGHGGMDYILVKEFIRALVENKPMPIDVYDAASWYAITPLSEKSIKHHGKPYKIPDFTRSKYKERTSLDVLEL